MAMVTREAAGLVDPKWQTPLQPANVKRIVVHWLGVSGSVDNPARTWRGVQKNHMDVRGWSDIAYNFGISKSGVLYTGRGIHNQPGANGKGNNHNALAICAILTIDEVPEDGFWIQLQKTVTGMKALYPEIYEVVGHKDIANTACPGPHIHPGLADITLDLEENGKWVDHYVPKSAIPESKPVDSISPDWAIKDHMKGLQVNLDKLNKALEDKGIL